MQRVFSKKYEQAVGSAETSKQCLLEHSDQPTSSTNGVNLGAWFSVCLSNSRYREFLGNLLENSHYF